VLGSIIGSAWLFIFDNNQANGSLNESWMRASTSIRKTQKKTGDCHLQTTAGSFDRFFNHLKA